MALTGYPSTVLTAGAANTKGSYAQIVASTAADSSRSYVILRETSATISNYLVDLATGAPGAETVVVANLAAQSNTFDALIGSFLPLSLNIPSGTRLSARCQSTAAGATLNLAFYLETRALGTIVAPVTYGTDLTGSRGTAVDPGAVANTKGAYVQFSASIATEITLLGICVCSAAGAITTGLSRWNVDVATGGAGSETVILPDLAVTAGTTEDSTQPAMMLFPVSIAAGTRLAVRCVCSHTGSDRVIRVTLIGMQDVATSGGGGGATSVAYVG